MRTVNNVRRYWQGFSNGAAEAGRQPSLDFQRAAGLRDIAAAYHFPENRSATEFDHWADSFCSFRDGDSAQESQFLQKTWDELVALNPELERIKPQGNATWLRYGIFGAASRFNPDDINFFIELQKRTDCSVVALLVHQVPSYKKLLIDIEARTGLDTEWVASPETLLKIHGQVKNRPVTIKEDFNHFAHINPSMMPSAGAIAAAQDYITPVIRKAGIGL